MTLPDAGTWAGLALLGGVVGLDGTSVGQLMLSRPLVSATLGGLVAGQPVQGAAVGVLLEALHLGVLPVGASRYPEGGPPAVAAGAVFALSPGSGTMLLVTLLFALAWESLCGWTVQWMRSTHARYAVPEGTAATELDGVVRGHLRAIAADFARGAAMAALGVGVLAALSAAVPLVRLPPGLPQLLAAGIAAAAFASAMASFGARLRWFFAGAAGGVLFLVLR
jgi:mannose/fructose/N-acetylgalactosamine-specific phosphotransferase system component IIC